MDQKTQQVTQQYSNLLLYIANTTYKMVDEEYAFEEIIKLDENTLSPVEVERAENAFDILDKDNNGYIETLDLKNALERIFLSQREQPQSYTLSFQRKTSPDSCLKPSWKKTIRQAKKDSLN
eukprot:TRINITY_DN122064_c0_g1_i1.p1 TRINITY_DN122064_c0_g1~~TRINITY_DN122064_c0_g1_i1.p1  ORF type:complete len:140 (+),score=7.85 TRINITY_DN122064_c0_g1_i1:55-420(+)